MKLSIIIPVYNEGQTINTVLNQIQSVSELADQEIIVVDDGSTDNTFDMVSSRTPSVMALRHEKNHGKSAAIRTALQHASGDFVIIQDADLEYDPRDIAVLLAAVQEHGADIVYGSRILGNKIFGTPHGRVDFYAGRLLLTKFLNIWYGTRLTDMPTCYKLIRRTLLLSLNPRENRFDFCPEVTAKLIRLGYTIREVPIHYRPRSHKEGKKIRYIDGLRYAWVMLKYRFLPVSRWFKIQ